jgi:prevent-host-death family protein
MFQTEGVSAIATITELRADTSTLIDHVTDHGAIMVQKNNEPHAALISWEMYKALKEKIDLKALQKELKEADSS